jgi:hypothetical protein
MELKSELSLTDSIYVKQPTHFATFRGRVSVANAVLGLGI